MIYVDKIDVFYSQNWIAHNDQAFIVDQPTGNSYITDGFSENSILAYDVSQPGQLDFFANTEIQDSSLGYSVSYGLNGSSSGRRIWVGTENSMLQSHKLKLIHGSDLSNPENQADILFIGHREMLGAIQELANFREQQGYKVYKASLQDIYNEFGKGLANTQSIKDFISFARQNWALNPSYIVLLGDGTYDPKAYQNTSMEYRFPIKFMMGSSFDYGSDNWYVADEDNHLPKEVIARIPAKNPQILMKYVQKVLAYENGSARPRKTSKLTFFSDTPHFSGEDFEKPIKDITKLKSKSSVSNPINHIKRSTKSDPHLNSAIINSFADSSLIHYMGHGAENMWADAAVFENADIQSLNNTQYPVVVAMNCLNAHFYDPDMDSLGELAVMKEHGGAIAFWGSTSMTPPSLQDVYQKSFYENLMAGQVAVLGDLVKMSKIQAGLSSPHEEILNSWVVIGDPLVSLSLKINQGNTTTAPPNSSPEATSSSMVQAVVAQP